MVGEPRGRFVHYRLSDPRIDELLVLAGELLKATARGVDSCENYRSDLVQNSCAARTVERNRTA